MGVHGHEHVVRCDSGWVWVGVSLGVSGSVVGWGRLSNNLPALACRRSRRRKRMWSPGSPLRVSAHVCESLCCCQWMGVSGWVLVGGRMSVVLLCCVHSVVVREDNISSVHTAQSGDGRTHLNDKFGY